MDYGLWIDGFPIHHYSIGGRGAGWIMDYGLMDFQSI